MSDTDKHLYIAITILHKEKEIRIHFFLLKVNKKNNVIETKHYQSV